MKTLLHIGEVAQLLGITTKTIRHYQKIGLLQEPERNAAGYRLFSAQDLLRVQRIRRLQELGLSLKQIKTILSEPIQQHSLREVLQALDQEFANEIEQIQARRERIRALLNETNVTTIKQLPIASPGLAQAQELLGEYLAAISPEMMEIEKQAWNLLDNFRWPDGYRASLEQLMRYFVDQPAMLNTLVSLSEQLTSLSALPEDAPEVDHLIQTFLVHDELIQALQSIHIRSKQLSSMAQPFVDVLSELLKGTFSPAQWRFFKTITEHATSIEQHKDGQV